MKESYLIVAGYEAYVNEVREVLKKLRHLGLYGIEVFQLPKWMGKERGDLAKTVKTLRGV